MTPNEKNYLYGKLKTAESRIAAEITTLRNLQKELQVVLFTPSATGLEIADETNRATLFAEAALDYLQRAVADVRMAKIETQ